MLEHHRFAGRQREAALGLRVGWNDRLSDAAVLPADSRPQQQEFASRLQFQDMAVLDLQRLGDQHHGLIQQRGDIVAYHGELAQGGHDRLLEGTVEEGLVGPLTFFDAFLKRGRHGIERARQLAQFAPLLRQAGPAGQITRAQLLGRFGQHPHLAEDEALTPEPRRRQGQQPDHKLRPGKPLPQ